MAERKTYTDPRTGEARGVSSELTADEIASNQAGRGVRDLGAAARAAQAKPKKIAEEDPSAMSPLARAAYENKKKRKATTDDAAAALASR